MADSLIFTSDEEANADSSDLIDAYRAYVHARAVRLIPWLTPCFTLAMVYFAFTDRYVRDRPELTYARVPGVLFSAVLLLAWFTGAASTRVLFGLFQLWLATVLGTTLAISAMLWGTEIFTPSIIGIMVAVFAITVASQATWRVLVLLCFVPLSLLLLYLLVFEDLDSSVFEYGNTVAIMWASIIIVHRNERLRFREFSLRVALDRERQRSDELILNILPNEIAQELKLTGRAASRRHDAATVMFLDFEGFTRLAEQVDARTLVGELNMYFTEFDHIAARHGVERIKTIGDAYMCAAGVPAASADHAFDVVTAAIEMQRFVRSHSEARSSDSTIALDARVGIHSGPVVAGIVGSQKFAYDIWGDTVNVASRIEGVTAPGMISISAATHELLGGRVDSGYLGELDIKNHGPVHLYVVHDS